MRLEVRETLVERIMVRINIRLLELTLREWGFR